MAIDPKDKSTGDLFMPLQGKRFVMTGRLTSMKRDEASRRILRLGGKVTQTISKKTDYIIIGANPGGKASEAREMGVKSIEEEELLGLLGMEPMPSLCF